MRSNPVKTRGLSTPLAEIKASPEQYQRTATSITRAARQILAEGRGWGHDKVFLSDLAEQLRMPMARLAPFLVTANKLGWLELQRADLRPREHADRIAASEVDDGIGTYHYLVVGEPMRENPAWVNRALADHYTEIRREFPLEWMPMIADARAVGRRGEVLVEFHEFGCGGYGCVLESNDPDVVVKVTTDSSEAEFVELGMEWGWPAGITAYYGHRELGKVRLTQRAKPTYAWLLFREAASHVGKIAAAQHLPVDAQLGGRAARLEAASLMEAAYDAGEIVMLTLEQTPPADRPDAFQRALRFQNRATSFVLKVGSPLNHRGRHGSTYGAEIRGALAEIEEEDPGAILAIAMEAYAAVAKTMKRNRAAMDMGEALLFYLAHGAVVTDLHTGNAGVVEPNKDRDRPTWAITDPGNVVMLPEPWPVTDAVPNPEPKFLPLHVVRKYEKLAQDLGVSKVARSGRGFLTAYREAGGRAERLPEWWRARRAAFIARHVAQLEARHEPLFQDGDPTRRHLALIMWAYSPVGSRL